LSIFSSGAQGSDLAHFLEDWSQNENLSEPLTRTDNHEKLGNLHCKKIIINK
jgi:hypothetical protein